MVGLDDVYVDGADPDTCAEDDNTVVFAFDRNALGAGGGGGEDGASDTCTPGALKCVNDSIHTCNEDSEWAYKGWCKLGCSNGECKTSCTPNEYFCTAVELKLCNSTGTSYLNSKDCNFGCVDGECIVRCQLGDLSCRNGYPVKCSTNGIQWVSNGSYCTYGCVDGACATCTPGTTVCMNNYQGECNAAGDGISNPTYCFYGCNGNQCTVGCTPGSYVCDEVDYWLGECNPEGTGYTFAQNCPNGCTGNKYSGACNP